VPPTPGPSSPGRRAAGVGAQAERAVPVTGSSWLTGSRFVRIWDRPELNRGTSW
jgi:hypothetical protein